MVSVRVGGMLIITTGSRSGLHVLFGFYDNAFDIVQRAYDELGRDPSAPWRRGRRLHAVHDLVFLDEYGGRWNEHVIDFRATTFGPATATGPHRRGDPPLIDTVLELVEKITGIDREEVVPTSDPGRQRSSARPVHFVTEQISRWLRRLGDAAEHEVDREVVRLLATELQRLEGGVDHLLASVFGSVALHCVRPRPAVEVVGRSPPGAERLRFAFTSLDLVGTDRVGDRRRQPAGQWLSEGQRRGLQAFLLRHGAEPFSVDNSPIVRGLYDLTFGFEGGDPTQPNLAAGQSIEALVRIGCLDKGSITYKMMAGMGDTIFGPIYQVLVNVVEFKMFNWVSKLGVSDNDNVIGTIEVIAQVDLEPDYPFLSTSVVCRAGPPSRTGTTSSAVMASDCPVSTSSRPRTRCNREPTVLHRGVDFDQVVLGISIGGLKPICADLGGERNTKFQAMLDNLTTVGTRAVQVWSGKSTTDLGWCPKVSSISTSYAEPLDTYCDMSHLIPSEAFPPSEVNSIGYFCGPLEDSGNHATDLAAVTGSTRLPLRPRSTSCGRRRSTGPRSTGTCWSTRPAAKAPLASMSSTGTPTRRGPSAMWRRKGHGRVPPAIRREWLQEPGARRRLDAQRHRWRIGGGRVRLRSDGVAGTVRFALIRAGRARTAGRWTRVSPSRRPMSTSAGSTRSPGPTTVARPRCTRSSRWPTSERSNGWWISSSLARLWVPRSSVRWRRW